MNDIAHSRPPPFFEITGARLRLWPILLAAAVMELGLVMAPRAAALWIVRSHPTEFQAHAWASLMLVLALQAVGGLLGIAVMRRVLPAADPCLRWPPGRTYVGTAIVIGAAMSAIMLVADYWPSLLAGTVPDSPYPIMPGTTASWLAAMSMAGIAEEIGFRGLLVGMLTVLIPGRIRAGRFEIPISGVIVSLLFGLVHYKSFIYSPLHLAISQLIYAFAFGLIYVWLMERSRSLLAPIIAHSLSDLLEIGLVILLIAVWG